MKWSIIVISWNVKDLLEQCLKSVEPYVKSGMAEVFVIDNLSQDGSPDMVREKFSWAHVNANAENVGFARAVNQGSRQSQGEYILLLNPDAALEPGALEELEKTFLAHPNAGIVGGRIMGPEGDVQPSVRGFPTTCVFALTILKLHNFFANSLGCLKSYFKFGFDYWKSQQADQVMGAFFAFPKKVWEETNGFDENFFLWYEEVDFCKRVKERGYEIWYTHSAVAQHGKGKSFAQVSAIKKQKIIQKSMRYYAKKHLGTFGWIVVSILSPMGLFLAWCVQLLKIKKSVKKQQAL